MELINQTGLIRTYPNFITQEGVFLLLWQNYESNKTYLTI